MNKRKWRKSLISMKLTCVNLFYFLSYSLKISFVKSEWSFVPLRPMFSCVLLWTQSRHLLLSLLIHVHILYVTYVYELT